ncbi:hypothetical protein LshimejAT787_0201340 [Lyophyllum shimeji]|uniref:F-box domain-containing protein n=1 Tax=Lyophyllum shimeji TaxID=47721 RepID=A0A9P3UHW3_LYOSH|nr:hypothetical protein LshimejAT787_0201340 [Lyophyllum shimeji]
MMQLRSDVTARALSIPEIVQTILANLDVLESSDKRLLSTLRPDCQAALARAAQVCRHFSSPVLDILWKRMRSIIPLLRVGGIFVEESNPYQSHSEFPSHLWNRLEAYARRVKSLGDYYPPVIDDRIIIRIAQHLRGKCLLPMLETLAYTLCHHIQLLISPSLRNIYINYPRLPHPPEIWWVLDFLHALKTDSPLLERFACFGPWPCKIPSLLSGLKHLRSMRFHVCVAIEDHDLTAALSLPQLTELKLHASSSQPQIPRPIQVKTYSSRSLMVTANALTTADILSHLKATPLENLEIALIPAANGSPGQPSRLRDCLAHIPSWSGSLHTFAMEYSAASCIEPQNTAPLSRLLHPLRRAPQLQSLQIFYPHGISPSDADYLELSLAWPQLQFLALAFAPAGSKPRATFLTLQQFATRCPNLRSLAIHLDLSTLPPSPLIASHQLQYLYIYGPVGCSEPEVLARYLDALFPNLHSTVETNIKVPRWLSGEGRDREEWTKVEKLRKLCQTARKDDAERRRLAEICSLA